MSGLTRRELLSLGARAGLAALGLEGLVACRRAPARLQTIVIQGAPSPPSLALLRVAKQGVPKEVADEARFMVWSTADEMRARITSGQAHFSGVPTNVAAALYNRGVPVQLLNAYIWGILYLVTSDPNLSSLADLKGQPVLIPFRGDLPDILTQYLLRREGVEMASFLQPNYVSTAPEAAQLLASGRAAHAVLSEPSATLAILKAKQNGITLRRAVDYCQVWAQATGRPPRLPMAVVVADRTLAAERPVVLEWFQRAHRDAVEWVIAHPDEATRMGADVFEAIPAEAMRESIPYIRFSFVEAQDARSEIEFFLSEMQSLSPDLIGGRLPPDEFYYRG
jgi:NitT/TauT family transport system substrate-binding protein